MRSLLERIEFNTRNIIIMVICFILIIATIVFISNKISLAIQRNYDVTDTMHGVILTDGGVLYKSPKESKWKDIRNLEIGDFVYIISEKSDKKGNEWYKVKAQDRIGYVLKNKVGTYNFEEAKGDVLMSDVSKFNVIYEHFKTPGEYASFLINSNMNYAYIRLGGRGYGDEGNFYTDPKYKVFTEACDFIGIPYGFYYIDEALTSEEIQEEVDFVKKFLKENESEYCVLPIVIDVEPHDGAGRADDIWDERAELVDELVNEFKKEKIDTILYTNANYANQYLYTVNVKFWIAYYLPEKKIPNYWYTKTDQEAAQNKELMDKVIAWQFTDKGAGELIKPKVDASLVKNEYFRKFVK